MNTRVVCAFPDCVAVGVRTSCLLALALGLSSCAERSETVDRNNVVRAAVAGNFAAPIAELVDQFHSATGIDVETSLGATGQLYAQIRNGAPYDLFLAADAERPRRLEEEGFAVDGTRFTYAIGRLVLYAPTWDSMQSGERALRVENVRHLAIANPTTAPYGAAAREVLNRWSLNDEMEDLIVRGENVAQAFQFVESGAAEVGFVALSQVNNLERQHYWIVPEGLHLPIRQEAVLLRLGQSNPHARKFLEFLQGEAGSSVISSFGYLLPENGQ